MIEMLGNIGDFLGGIGVLVSLIYLAFQVRQNTTTSKANSYQDAVAATNAWSREVGTDPDACRLLQLGSVSYADLEATQKMQFALIMASFFRNMENLHEKFARGVIDESVWHGWANRTFAFLDSPGVLEWWRLNESAFTEDFRRYLRDERSNEFLSEGPGSFPPPAA